MGGEEVEMLSMVDCCKKCGAEGEEREDSERRQGMESADFV